MNHYNTNTGDLPEFEEAIRKEIRSLYEDYINKILLAEMDVFLGYLKYKRAANEKTNFRNGYRNVKVSTPFGDITVNIPRDRLSCFVSTLMQRFAHKNTDLTKLVLAMNKKGISDQDKVDILSEVYGDTFGKSTISYINKSVSANVTNFHEKLLEEEYLFIYVDATFVKVCRDSYSSEALHVIMGVTKSGHKQVLAFGLNPTESASYYEELLQNLRNRGVKKILYAVSDGISGFADALHRVFPSAKHQRCWTHIQRNIRTYVSPKLRKQASIDCRNIYTAESREDANKQIDDFIKKYQYRQIRSLFKDRESILTLFDLPIELRHYMYTTNTIENCHAGFKQHTRTKKQFHSEETLLQFACLYYIDFNDKYESVRLSYFSKYSDVICELFNEEQIREK